ncbi:malonate--CoA ligase [Heracleum sosnowskyi]|uniref:Malonate--CoA ligase n=1 Tax=Heracleum sosnowskyi TaxID=360622 RepID=A0AAD8M8C7_9APIA|nr:malonate--CoA ligase [Heracleum sosnowskyi]
MGLGPLDARFHVVEEDVVAAQQVAEKEVEGMGEWRCIEFPSNISSSNHRHLNSPSRVATNSACSFSHTRCLSSDTASDHSKLMDVFKAISKQGHTLGDRVAIRADKKSYTYFQLVSSACKISQQLFTSYGKTVDGTAEHLGGARVGIVAKPSAEFVAGVLATWFSGGVAVPLALSYPEAELLHVMNDSDVSMVLSTEDHQELMKNIADKKTAHFSLIPSVPSSETTRNGTSQAGETDNIENSDKITGEDPAMILYTSGTTGKPKGVVHTHKSILAQVQILSKAWEYTSSDQFLNCLPLHLYAGSAVEFMPKFSVRGIWQRWCESYPKDGTRANDAITVFTGVPTMYSRLIQGYENMDPEAKVASASAARQLRLMMSGSSALPLPVMQQWETITGHRLLERYGMTEFVMGISNPLKGLRKGGTVGNPLPGVQTKILGEDDDAGNPTGVGELCIKSPSLFKEYWNLPEVTRSSFTDDHFFKTGDAVTIDEDGYFVILGRNSADIMKVGGYKLSALEIEATLLDHPSVSECCVLGLMDKTYGEIVCAIIVPEAEVKRKREEKMMPALSLEELSTWAKEKLAPYKIPTRLILWDSIPRNAMGKVNKKELKNVLAVIED